MRHAARVILSMAAFVLPVVPGAAQSPPAFSTAPSTASYVATGPSTDADLARLRAVLLKVTGVQQVDLAPRKGGAILHIRGPQTGTLFATAAKSVGFDLRTMPVRTYLASGLASGSATETNLARLQEALTKASGVEQVDLGKANGATVLRIRGEAEAPALAAIAKSVGFEMLPVSSYVASGPTADADLARLRAALGKVSGVSKLEMRGLPGGAAVVIQGDVTDAALTSTAKSVGFGLLPVSDAGGSHRFSITGTMRTEEEEKLRKAFQDLGAAGESFISSKCQMACNWMSLEAQPRPKRSATPQKPSISTCALSKPSLHFPRMPTGRGSLPRPLANGRSMS